MATTEKNLCSSVTLSISILISALRVGYVVCMMSHPTPTVTVTVLLYGRVEGKRPVGRPDKQWLDVIEEGNKILGITWQGK